MSRRWSRSRNSSGLHSPSNDIARTCPAHSGFRCNDLPEFCAPLLYKRTQCFERREINLGELVAAEAASPAARDEKVSRNRSGEKEMDPCVV